MNSIYNQSPIINSTQKLNDTSTDTKASTTSTIVNANGRTVESVNMCELPYNVFKNILQNFSRHNLLEFRLVCRSTRVIAEPVIRQLTPVSRTTIAEAVRRRLSVALFSGNTHEVVTILKFSGIPIDSCDRNGFTALIWAAMLGHVDTVKKLIEMRADANAMGSYGDTALIIAAAHGYTKVVNMLITAGADINRKDKYGKTGLMFAVRNGHIKIVEQLIKLEADMKDKDNGSLTVPMFALD